MKSRLPFLLLAALALHCRNHPAEEANRVVTNCGATDALITKEQLFFACSLDVRDRDITNNTDRRVDILLNGVKGFLGARREHPVFFHPEELLCGQVRRYRGGLLFCRRYLLSSTGIASVKLGLPLPDSAAKVDLVRADGREDAAFRFSEGSGVIRFMRPSCIDADFDKVRLVYGGKCLEIRNVLDAHFFECDLDGDGMKEQYVLGERNCTAELAILRIRGRDAREGRIDREDGGSVQQPRSNPTPKNMLVKHITSDVYMVKP